VDVSVFLKGELIARGPAERMGAKLGELEPLNRSSDLLAFDDETGRQVDLDLRDGSPARSRGRPSLGVVPKEVTLLPRHWDWLAGQRGGASATLRKLVELEMRKGRSDKECHDAAFRFLNVMAGDLPGFEEAIRAIYAGNLADYDRHAVDWPYAVRDHGRSLAWPGDAA